MIRYRPMSDTIITARQGQILAKIEKSVGLSRKEIKIGLSVSVPTISRDLVILSQKGFIKRIGRGRGTKYISQSSNLVTRRFDLDSYFNVDPDERLEVRKSFDFEIFSKLRDIFSRQEIVDLEKINKKFSTKEVLARELERFVIELSWKSSKIEGNTYSLLDTESLIKEKIEVVGHSKIEAAMILNHKQAFDLILKNRKEFKKISVSQINQLHNTLVRELDVVPGVRTRLVGITGTVYRPLDNQWQIKEAMVELVKTINKAKFPLEKALVAMAMISYIQPFVDGNKRTGRMLANALLLAYDFYPLSYRSVNEVDYKKGLILFYEQNSLYELKKIIIEQFKFSLETYF